MREASGGSDNRGGRRAVPVHFRTQCRGHMVSSARTAKSPKGRMVRKIALGMFVLLLSCGCREMPTPLPPSREAANRFLPRYRFSTGEELQYLLRSSFTSQALGENPEKVSTDQEVEFRRNVLEVLPGGVGRIAVVIGNLRIVTSRPGQETLVFDSDGAQAILDCPEELLGIAFLVGKEIEIEQAPSGEIVGVAGLAPIFRKALAELSPKERQPVERLLRELASRPTGFLGLDVILPSEALGVGKTWSAEEGPFPIFCGRPAYRWNYRLKDVSDDECVVEFTGELGAEESPLGSQLRQFRKAEVQGSFSFDLGKRLLKEMRGESYSFLSIGGREQLRTTTAWELTLRNVRCP